MTVRLNIGDTNKSTIISEIYKPPNTDIIHFKDHILQYFNNLTIKNYLFINYDFNINILNHNLNTNIKYFIDAIFSLGLHPLIDKSTIISDHSHSLTDNIYCNKKKHPILNGILINYISDHFMIFTGLKTDFKIHDKLVNENHIKNKEIHYQTY